MQSELEIFVHGKGSPQIVNALMSETLKDVLARYEALPEAGQFVFVGESIEILENPECENDSHQPVDIDLTIEILQLDKHKHVHTRAAHRIEAVVHFNGVRERLFSPATTVATVTAWAKKAFQIDPAGGADYVLELIRDKTQPRPEVHLGELALGHHKVEFGLIREVTPQGY